MPSSQGAQSLLEQKLQAVEAWGPWTSCSQPACAVNIHGIPYGPAVLSKGFTYQLEVPEGCPKMEVDPKRL